MGVCLLRKTAGHMGVFLTGSGQQVTPQATCHLGSLTLPVASLSPLPSRI